MSEKIAELTIDIKDNSTGATQTVKSLSEALTALKSSANGQKGLKNVSKTLTDINNSDMSGFGRLAKALDSALKPARELASALSTIQKASGSIRMANNISRVSKTMPGSNLPTQIRDATMGVNNSYQEVIERSNDGLREAQQENKKLADTIKETSSATKNYGKVARDVFQNSLPFGIGRTISQFMRLAKMKILRSIISTLLKGFSEGLQNVYYWAKATGDQFATTMDSFATMSNYAKNSIGAAFSSLLISIIPIINKIIDAIVTVINYINMFFATLRGESTYTRAKKNAVEYGEAVAGSLGGAAGAAKELKEELSVLPFDELNQLVEQPTPSSGSGGGGGAGGSATDYNNMFEKAEIESNWLTKTAGWLKENFQDLLPIIEAIGAGILAWKISSALSSALNTLFGIGKLTAKQTLGIALTIGGMVLSYEGGRNLAKEGKQLQGIIESAVGTLATVAGLSLVSGSIAVGLALGVPIGIAVTLIGYIKERNFQALEQLKNDPGWKQAMEDLEKTNSVIELSTKIRMTITGIGVEYEDKINQADAAQSILDKIKSFDGQVITTNTDLSELNRLVNAYNSMGLTDIQVAWQNVNGVIKTNVDEVQNALDEYKKYAKEVALTQYMVEQAKAEAQKTVIDAQADYVADMANMYLEQLAGNSDWNTYLNKDIGGGASFGWQPGEPVPESYYSVDPEMYNTMKSLESYLDQYSSLTGESDALQAVIDATQAQIDVLAGIEQNTADTVTETQTQSSIVAEERNLVNACLEAIQGKQFSNVGNSITAGMSVIANRIPKTLAIQAMQEQSSGFKVLPTEQRESSVNIGEYAYQDGHYIQILEAESEAIGDVNDALKEQKKTVPAVRIESIELAAQQEALNNAFGGSAKPALMVKNAYNDVFSAMKYGTIEAQDAIKRIANVDVAGIASTIKNKFASQSWQTIGTSIKGRIEGEVKKTGQGVDASGSYNTVTNKFKAKSWGTIGTSVKTGIETVINKVGKDVDYTGIKDTIETGIGKQSFSNAGKSIQKAIAGAVNNVAKSVDSQSIMTGIQKGLANAEANTPFSEIGKSIGEDIKWGMSKAFKSVPITINASIAGLLSKQYSGTMTGSIGSYAIGGYPDIGDLFFANENGAEMVGTLGGKTAVVNNEQIASALAKALQPMLSNQDNGSETINTNVYLDSAVVARATVKGQRAMNKQYNITAKA